MDYLDFEVEIGEDTGDGHLLRARSATGDEVRVAARFPFTAAQVETQLLKLENAILRASGLRRTNLTPQEEAVQQFGRELFTFLLTGQVAELYRECQREASLAGRGTRLKLRIQPPHLTTLPWEFLFDPRRGDYVCLDPDTPLVRYLDLPQRIRPLAVQPPLRILAMIASPKDLPALDVTREKGRLERALRPLQNTALVEITWLEGESWRSLQRVMRPNYGPWHIFHFIGHGGYDPARDEGLIILSDEQGAAQRISATGLSRLLARQRASLRLVLLNACEGARGGHTDLFSGTAATLVRSGVPAVLAMQYAITDAAALEFSRTFYEALADGLAVDTAVSDARNAINFHNAYSLEWGTPVLHMRAVDGRLFEVTEAPVVTMSTSGVGGNRAERALEEEAAPHIDAETTRGVAPSTPIDFDWVTIPAGPFLMGSDKQKDSLARDNKFPQHEVDLPEFRIARTPVTNAQYQAFVQATDHRTPSHWENGTIPQGKENHPVVNVSWQDAVAFCQWAGVRLPSEAEWEKAARGTDGRIYPWGNDSPTERHCNFNMNIGDTTPVGQYSDGASPYEVLDMAGNVWEWTSSLWGKDRDKPNFGYPYDSTDGREDPQVAGRRVLRGGSFFIDEGLVRCAVRYRFYIAVRFNDLGFRVSSPGL